MNVTVNFRTQVLAAAGTGSINIDIKENGRFGDLIVALRNRSLNKLNSMLFNDDQKLSGSLLFTLNNEKQIREKDNILLKDGDVITIISPISGG